MASSSRFFEFEFVGRGMLGRQAFVFGRIQQISGQMADLEPSACEVVHRVLQAIDQFADIARPVMGHEHGFGLGIHAVAGDAETPNTGGSDGIGPAG